MVEDTHSVSVEDTVFMYPFGVYWCVQLLILY